MADEIHISQGDIARAKQKLGHADSPISLSTGSLKDSALRLLRRKFYDQEKAMYKQKYLGRVVEGRPVNSCRIASAIIALARMGVIGLNEQSMTTLERELVESAVKNNHVAASGDTGPSVPYIILTEFGLPTGFANSVAQVEAALKAGGCVCFGRSGHSRCATELSPDGRQIKVFDPLQDISSIEPLRIMDDRVRAYSGQMETEAVVVYPPNYQPNPAKGEIFYPPGVVNNLPPVNFNPIPININRYK